MLKYYKDFFSDYQYAGVIQTILLLIFVAFFVAVFVMVWKKPKGYYKELEQSALDIDENQEKLN